MAQDTAYSANGRLVVVALLLIGTIAGLGAVYYWSTWVVVVDPNGVLINGKPGTMTAKEIEKQFERLSKGINEAMNGPGKLSDGVLTRIVVFVDDHPEHAGGYTLLGQAQFQNGKWQDSYKSWTRSLQLNNQQPELLINTGTLALEMVGGLEKQTPPDDVIKDAAKRDQWLKDKDAQREKLLGQAELHYSQAIELDNGNARYYFFLGSLYFKREQFDEAEELLDQALELDSSLFAAHFQTSQIYLKQGNYQRAIEALDDAIDNVPDTKRELLVLYLLEKARILRLDDRPEESSQVLTDSLTPPEQDQENVVEALTEGYRLMEQYELAAQLWERRMRLFRKDWKPAAEAAKWRLKAGQLDLARRHLQSWKSRSPLHPLIQEFEKQLYRAREGPVGPDK